MQVTSLERSPAWAFVGRHGSLRVWLTASVFIAASASAGPAMVEPPGGDAGGSRSSAMSGDGTGPLATIGGSLGGTAAAAAVVAAAGEDFEDMFKFRICEPELFSARTSSNFDTQLWLFDENGMGVLGNNDTGAKETQARIFPPANDGTHQVLPGEGVYYLAISGAGNSPLGGGELIFHLATSTERSGPDGQGGQSEHSGWSGPGDTGAYIIYLQGAALLQDDCQGEYVTQPLVPAITEWGAVSFAIVLLSAGTILLGKRITG